MAFAAIGILFAAYTRYKSESNRLKSLQKRHEIQYPIVDYEYDRFNTKEERNTNIAFDNDQFEIVTDIQNIRIANQTLVSRISSEFNEIPILFDIVIQPFEKVLFDIEGFTNFNQDGILILWSYGVHTKMLLEEIEKLKYLSETISSEPGGVYLVLNSFKIDKAENSVILYGTFRDGNEFVLKINYKTFRLKFNAPLNSILSLNNFKNIDDLENNET